MSRKKAPDHDSIYRVLCEAAGWKWCVNSPTLLRESGEHWGITNARRDNIYDTWETCYFDWVAHPETPLSN